MAGSVNARECCMDSGELCGMCENSFLRREFLG
eukprot:CAMPEP_0184655908 /NCGR_PEP_ID=MMETSP0308-20130426/14895_1 /TAXON_ID=38269 /ORGANISM="Gloeochaete witrockiana, Strain SAG 46.84" /LENGTH=32 /DNA_ID= /DNA_START= /DNA_END= /DNA_ORIENTATION=